MLHQSNYVDVIQRHDVEITKQHENKKSQSTSSFIILRRKQKIECRLKQTNQASNHKRNNKQPQNTNRSFEF